jgi:cell division protein FtsX
VVGVFDSENGTTRGGGDRVYTAHGTRWPRDELLIRTTAPAKTMIPTVQALVRRTAPDLPVLGLETLAERDARNDRDAARVGYGVAAAAALALLLASIGLYAVVSLAVGSRQREIGIRMALGGRPNRVAAMFFASGVRLSAIGLVVGLPVSLIAVRMIAANVIGPSMNLPAAGAGIALVLVAVASAATWFPARRAAAVDPARPLRSE